MLKRKYGVTIAAAAITVSLAGFGVFSMTNGSVPGRSDSDTQKTVMSAADNQPSNAAENTTGTTQQDTANQPTLMSSPGGEAVALAAEQRADVNVSRSSVVRVLKPGVTGDEVKDLQNKLKALGFFSHEVTGVYGELTAIAVSNLQEANGLFPDGTVGEKTMLLIAKLASGQPAETSNAAQSSQAAQAQQAPTVLKLGMRGTEVAKLQEDLKKLGYFQLEATGYYGDITESAVRRMQSQHGLAQDGTVGGATTALVQKLVSQGYKAPAEQPKPQPQPNPAPSTPPKGGSSSDYLVSWFGGAENIFSIGSVATIYDIDSGLSFKAKRTYGYNHADTEPLTYNDAQTMKRIFGGWSWSRRAIIVETNGRRMAASMAGMPHAGSDKAAANAYVEWRSGDYGPGVNLDTVKGNGFDGHFDVHFLNSKTHGSNQVDSAHQSAVRRAAAWAAGN